MADKVVEVMPPNETVALVPAVGLDEDGAPTAAQKIGRIDILDFQPLPGTLQGVALEIRSGREKVHPPRTAVELGTELAASNCKLTGMLVEATASVSPKVTLEWAGDKLAGH